MAAHFPTERSRFQTADVAERLHRGGALYQGEEEEPGLIVNSARDPYPSAIKD